MKLTPFDFILFPLAIFIATVLLLFSSCAPDSVLVRQRQGESIEAQIKYHQGKIDSLKRVGKTVWDL
jgi:hypothetical protein